jgi:glucuronate isomerase
MTETEKLVLDENRFFDPDPGVRSIARELYEGVKALPIVSPHGHVDPSIFASDAPFQGPTALILIPDHYAFRMLYSQGIKLESLGIPTVDGTMVEKDHRKIWQLFADYFYLFAGTPTGVWLNHELSEVFGIREKLCGATAMRIYDQIDEKLKSPGFRPRALFEKFNIEVLTTTDGAADILTHHKNIRESGWKGNIIPCFRPDAVIDITHEDWKKHMDALREAAGKEIGSFRSFIQVLQERRHFFKSMGAVSTDHACHTPFTRLLHANDVDTLFKKALRGKATREDGVIFTAHMLMEMAWMSVEDGLVMQIHPGCFRNHNQTVFRKFGTDKGCDIPVRVDYARNLYELLNKYGNNPKLNLIVFTLDESNYSRELSPLAGHYPALKLGPPWWFHDSIEGMMRYRTMVTETAGIYNTAGFNDDTRAFPSIPARHDLSRRVDSNFLARLVATHVIDMKDAETMSKALAYDLVKKAYKLD